MHRILAGGFVLLLAVVSLLALAVAPTTQVAKLLAADATAGDTFGVSVSISGDTMVVGAPEDDDAGSAYVFERNAGGADHWGQVRKLTASATTAQDMFGWSVSISGDTIVVGAPEDDAPSADSGMVYVFERNAGGADNWGQVGTLIPPDLAAFDQYGGSVSISGDMVVAGASNHINAGFRTGLAYVFSRNAVQGVGADTWSYVARLISSDAAQDDNFGITVSISGDTAIVGASGHDHAGSSSGSAYVFERNAGGADSWDEVAELTASDAAGGDGFGFAVSISGDTALVGAHGNDDAGPSSGSAYVFERNTGGADHWDEVAKLTATGGAAEDHFGVSVSIDGDAVIVGTFTDPDDADGANAAYVFERNAGGADSWDQVAELNPSDAAPEDLFGHSVSISGDTAAVGAYGNDDAGSYSGSAYTFSSVGCSWAQIAKPVASDAQGGDQFGQAAAISRDTAVVGAYLEDPVSTNSGSAYVFARNTGGADSWDQVAKLIAADAANGDNFGVAVSISGDKVVVGAHHANPLGAGDAGAAYVFERNAGGADGWDQVAKLTASLVNPGDSFGNAVSIDVDTVVVGAFGYDGVGSSSGSAYVFERNVGGADAWGHRAQLFASDQLTSDFFGWSVAISGDTVVIGAPGNDDAGASSGSAYVFGRNVGGADAWDQVVKLTASDAAAGDNFGHAVSISGDTIVIGAIAGGSTGAAYVFERNEGGANQWHQVMKLTASDAAASDLFGRSVSISVDTIVVGANSNDDAGSASGSAYVFERNQGGANAWGEVVKLTALDAAADDTFGITVSIDAGAIIVGANGDDDAGSDAGSTYVFSGLDPAGDSDGDGVSNASDCAAVDGGTWTIPGEARNLQLSHNVGSGVTSLAWQIPLQPGGTTVRYDAVRSAIPSNFATSALCVLSDGLSTTTNDSGALAPGTIYFYLVRGENSCGLGFAGTGADGVAREVQDCP